MHGVHFYYNLCLRMENYQDLVRSNPWMSQGAVFTGGGWGCPRLSHTLLSLDALSFIFRLGILYLVPELSAQSIFSASPPLPGLWGPGLVQCRVVTLLRLLWNQLWASPSTLPEPQGLECKPEQSSVCKAQCNISLSSPGCTVFPWGR